MRSIEFRCWRDFLGLPQDWCANQFGCSVRTLSAWERRDQEIPKYAATMMSAWIEYANTVVGKLTVADLGRVIMAPMDYYVGDDLAGMPPTWHRQIAARVAERTGYPIVAKGSGVTTRDLDLT